MSDFVQRSTDHRGVTTLRINRPEVHNAFNDATIAQLCDALSEISRSESTRVVILTGNGNSFSSGADLNWMRAMASYDKATNRTDARHLAQLLRTLDELPKPTIAAVNGPAFGGGVGLVAACDIAIASSQARFALTEVRLGLVPAVISPYVVHAIGVRQARRFGLTAEIIEADRAAELGLVHEVVAADQLDAAVEATVSQLLKGGPRALQLCKQLLRRVAVVDEAREVHLDDMTARLIAKVRVSEEGQEGLTAFLDKRKPNWLAPEMD